MPPRPPRTRRTHDDRRQPPDLRLAARAVGARRTAPRRLNATAAARLLLALAYPWLAHAASTRQDTVLAAIALGDIALIVLLLPLLQRRGWAWALALAIGAGLVALAHSHMALLPLMLVPVAVVALVGWGFGRTLRAGRVPLITRIVAAMDGVPPAQLAPELLRYTRGLTAAWAALLATHAVLDTFRPSRSSARWRTTTTGCARSPPAARCPGCPAARRARRRRRTAGRPPRACRAGPPRSR